MSETVYLRFNGDFADGLEFVEAEDESGKSIKAGEWERADEGEYGDWKMKLEVEDNE